MHDNFFKGSPSLVFSFALEKLFIHYHVKTALVDKVTQKMAAILTWYIGEKQVSEIEQLREGGRYR